MSTPPSTSLHKSLHKAAPIEKLPTHLTLRKIAKMKIFGNLKKKSPVFGNFLTVKLQFSGGQPTTCRPVIGKPEKSSVWSTRFTSCVG